jgi:hypothetical protein
VAVNVEFQLIARRLARPPRRLHLDPRKLCRRNVRSVDKGVDESDRILGATCSRANPKCEPCAIPAARPPTPAYKSGREQMRDEIEETVERLTAREASRDLRDALLSLHHKWTLKRSRISQERQQRTYMLGRLGEFLHYFNFGYLGGDPTPDDRRLVKLIEKPRDADDPSL